MKKIAAICFASWLGLLHVSDSLANESTYKVGPGDVLQITVAGETDFTGSYTVRSDNTIFYSYVKSVPVNGMTTKEIADKLNEILKRDYINDPTVNVTIKEYASKTVKVLGAVAKPGSYTLTGDTRILDIITMAGGLEQQAGSNIMVIRAAKNPTVVVSNSDNNQKTPVTAMTPDTKSTLDNQPAAITTNPATADKSTNTPQDSQAVSKSVTPPVAEEPPLNEPIIVNYTAIVSEGRLDQNILLEPNDVINVPKGNEVMVMGQVTRPGPVPYRENLTILQAVGAAGGPSPTASTKSAYIIRKSPNGISSKVKIRLDRIMEQKAENIVVLANDVIVVPESFF